jgi:hypothetical protein
MTTALQLKLLTALLAVLGVIGGLLVRGGRHVDVMSAQPVTAASNKPTNDDHEKQYRRFVAPATKRYLIP